MKAVVRVLILGWVIAGLAACISRSNQGAEDLSYKKKAIDVGISATADLNYYNGQSHTVYVTFYQLSQPNMYNQMLESREGIAQLVAGGEFDKTVLSHQSLVIQPGEFRQVLLDRVEGARYLAAVAGYRNSNPRRISRVYPVELRKTITFYWRNLDTSAKMRVNMRLGRDGVMRLSQVPR